MSYTNIAKPVGTSYTAINNAAGQATYDQADLTYDNANTYYDGSNPNLYTNLTKPVGTSYTNIAKP